ncbi:MAG: S49 family peptidase [Proteobacteria bacterium]|nr:S49 family peptidase [Pseudomonadota bacterium]
MEEILAKELLADRRKDRRWRNIRWVGWMIILILFLIIFLLAAGVGSNHKSEIGAGQPYVALIRLTGIIMPETDFSAEKVVPQLNEAFTDNNAKGVVLIINSPGGSPVQASIIHDKIVALKQKYKKKVIVVGEDALASGSYLVATAADKIYVNNDTLTGSIGVIMEGFGANDAIAKIGIQRRVFTAGANKDRLDPFQPLKPEDVAKVKTVLDQVHQSFINDVLTGRQGKLKGDQKELFSGDFWSGQQAVQLGLADDTLNLWDAMEKEFNTRYYKDYSVKPSFLQELLGNVGTELHLNFSQQFNKHLDASI